MNEVFFEVSTLGAISQSKRFDPNQGPKVTTPAGCHWFRSCDDCRWETCVVDNPVKYDSDRGREARGKAFAGMLQVGMPLSWLAEFFSVEERQVSEDVAAYRPAMPGGHKFRPEDRAMVKAEAVKRRVAGESETLVARDLGVSTRQVRYWCKGVEGIERAAGNRWRKTLATMVVQPSPANEYMSKRCAVVRDYIECSYTRLP